VATSVHYISRKIVTLGFTEHGISRPAATSKVASQTPRPVRTADSLVRDVQTAEFAFDPQVSDDFGSRYEYSQFEDGHGSKFLDPTQPAIFYLT